MTTTQKRLEAQVKEIAETLNNGFSYVMDEWGDYRDEDGYATAPNAWLEDCLDIEYRVKVINGNKEVVGAEILVAFGGPNILVDTAGLVEGYWGGDHASARFESSVGDELLRALIELFDC